MEQEENIIHQRKNKIIKIFSSWIKDNYDKTFLIILILAFLIRLWFFFKTLDQPLWYDAASYLATAKNWGLGLGIKDIWYYRRGFLFPLICAFFFKFGLGETGIRFIEVLFSTGIVAVSYFLIRDMFNKKLALAVSICLSLSWIILFFTCRPLTSIPATFFLLLALLFFWKGYALKKGNKFIYLFAIFFALACLTRMQYLMFAPIFLIYIFTKEKFNLFKNKSLWISLGIFLLILTPFFIMSYQHYGNPLTDIASHYLGIGGLSSEQPVVERDFSKIHYYFLDLPYILYNPLIFVFLIGVFYFFGDLFLGLDKIFKSDKLQKKLFVLLWIIIPFLFLGYMIDYVEQRYVIPILPLLFLIVATSLFGIKNLISKKINFNKKYLTLLVFIVLILLLIPNFLWANDLTESKKTSYLQVKQAGLWLKDYSNPEDIVITASEPQIQYYSERSTYIPEANESAFNEMIGELKPRFLILSIFEAHSDWLLGYPSNNQDILTPVQVYQQGEQPLLAIYEFNYQDAKLHS